MRTASARTESSFDGTCHARPHAPSKREAATRVRATSSVNVQLCGTSRSPGASLEVRVPAGFVQRVADQMELDAARARFETRHLLRDARLSHIAWALDAEQRAGAPGGSLYMDSLGVALSLQLLLSSQPAPLPRRSGLSSLQVQRVIDFVEANLDGRLSLGSLASVAGVSCSHLQRGFKSSKGLTVHRYVMSRRVERARALLMQRSLPASEVAFAAGFSHRSHMARWMRKVLGVTPRGLAQR
jgi:AraC family transcriptional regulator